MGRRIDCRLNIFKSRDDFVFNFARDRRFGIILKIVDPET